MKSYVLPGIASNPQQIFQKALWCSLSLCFGSNQAPIWVKSFSVLVKICALDLNSQISFPGEKSQTWWNWEAQIEADNLEDCIPNSFGSLKEWDDADIWETEIIDCYGWSVS